MSCFVIGCTIVMFLLLGGTKVTLAEMSWWEKCQVRLMSVGQTSMALMTGGQTFTVAQMSCETNLSGTYAGGTKVLSLDFQPVCIYDYT
jgi:hypothetical protein